MRTRAIPLLFAGWILAAVAAAETPVESAARTQGPVSADDVTGAAWSRALTNVVFSSRDSHTSVVFGGKVWVIGGWHTGSLADVWASADGVTWKEVLAGAPWPARKAHSSVVFDDRMWILGGTHGVDQLADVWASEDGKAWTLLTSEAPWGKRNNLAAAVFDGRIWVTGGWGAGADGKKGNLDDVWSSADGVEWRRVAEHAPWRPRNNHTLTVWDGRLWLIGGWGEGNVEEGNLGDVWATGDGETWRPVTAEAPWLPRNAHTTVVFEDKLWVIGGWSHFIGGTSVNDLWFAEPLR